LFPGTAVLAERHKWETPFSMAGWSSELRSSIRFWKAADRRPSLSPERKSAILGLLLEVDRDLPSPGLAAVGKMRLFADTAATGRSAP
jgi:hypothetical protein